MDRERIRNGLILLFIMLFGGLFRLQGLDWDEGHHLNPDERYISMVLSSLTTPRNLPEYFDPNRSPLSPYTHGFGSYIYGQFPITVLTYLGGLLTMHDYSKNYILGRYMSAILDLGSVALIFVLGSRLWSKRVGLLGAFFYASAPLAIQYAHFMVMESWTVFSWLFLILFLTTRFRVNHFPHTIFLGILWGVTLAIKASSILLFPIITLCIASRYQKKNLLTIQLFNHLIIVSVFAVLSFRFLQPTIFSTASWIDWSLRSDFYQAFTFQQQAIEGKVLFPPSWQWVNTPKWWFPLRNIVLWGMGPMAGILAIVGIFVVFWRGRSSESEDRPQYTIKRLLALWIIGVFFWQGGKFVKVLRYFLPFFPLLTLFAASTIDAIRFKRSDLEYSRSDLIRKIVLMGSVIFSGVWAFMFTTIYRTTTTRIAASQWIYQNIPNGSSVMLEEWDDPLPLSLPGYAPAQYISLMEPVYAPDNEKKKLLIDGWIKKYEWIILSSPRAKGSIGKLPQQFPLMSRFYNDLESGTLGFVKAAEFTSFPKLEIGNWKLEINDSSAEESFWIYDHPKVEIYRKITLK